MLRRRARLREPPLRHCLSRRVRQIAGCGRQQIAGGARQCRGHPEQPSTPGLGWSRLRRNPRPAGERDIVQRWSALRLASPGEEQRVRARAVSAAGPHVPFFFFPSFALIRPYRSRFSHRSRASSSPRPRYVCMMRDAVRGSGGHQAWRAKQPSHPQAPVHGPTASNMSHGRADGRRAPLKRIHEMCALVGHTHTHTCSHAANFPERTPQAQALAGAAGR
ncbi:hypothetical protein DFH11DRAFT_257361 [Phellopilus nigrolimitatus]|nr:hypothetical protein DFH11DRAFT_257361 [Phellopilus nigrolimitatus]